MKAELTAIIHPAPEGGFWAVCPEVPGANGQGESVEEAKQNLQEAVHLILLDRLEEMKRALPENAIQATISVGSSGGTLRGVSGKRVVTAPSIPIP